LDSPARLGGDADHEHRHVGFRVNLKKMVTTLLDDEEAPVEVDPKWSCPRQFGFKILHGSVCCSQTSIFDYVIGAVVIFNIITMIIEADAGAGCLATKSEGCVPYWIEVTNVVLLAIYTVELVLRLFVHRMGFFLCRWNILDFIIVVCGLLGMILDDVEIFKRVSILRLLRVARIIRVAAILKRFPVLMHFIGGFIGAMQAMFWGMVLILTLLVMWSLMAVEVIYPESLKLELAEDDICRDAFSSVFRSTLTFFQTLVAGDSWGACAIPIINRAPQTYLLFAMALVTVQLGFTNLVLAVIVDKANEARETEREERRKETRHHEAECLNKWAEIMNSLDTDASGTISKAELLTGYKNKEIGDQLEELNIGSRDLSDIFELMDSEDSGEVPYTKFIECFRKAQQQDARVYMMFLQLRLQSIESRLLDFMERWRPDDDGRGRKRASRSRRTKPSAPEAKVAPQRSELACELGIPTAARGECRGDDRHTLPPPRYVLSEDFLQSLRESIDRRLDDIVAEAVESVERLQVPQLSSDTTKHSSHGLRAQVVSRPTARPSSDFDLADPASGERPLPCPPPRPRPAEQYAPDAESCVNAGMAAAHGAEDAAEACEQPGPVSARHDPRS